MTMLIGAWLLHQPLYATSSGVYFEHSPCVTRVHPIIPNVNHIVSKCFAEVGTISLSVADNITP